MKYIYLLLVILVFYTSSAQEVQLFENTWHLRTVQSDDMAFVHDVAEMNPPIAPYLIISEDLSFNGEGACNSFNGTFSFYPSNVLTTTEFDATTDDCGVQEQNRFEIDYFGFISLEFEYEISHDGQGAVLTMGTPMGGVAVFKSYSLSTNDFYKNELTVYPNPVNDVLVLSSKAEIGDLTIKIFNIEGKLLITQYLALEKEGFIDVSSLSNGIYFLNIEEENRNKAIMKFIKK